MSQQPNRAARRRAERAARKSATAILNAIDRGRPVVGLTGACSDCGATGSLTPISAGQVLAEVWHDPSCPAARGVVAWRPEGA